MTALVTQLVLAWNPLKCSAVSFCGCLSCYKAAFISYVAETPLQSTQLQVRLHIESRGEHAIR